MRNETKAKSSMKRRTEELVDDLNAVRAAVLEKQGVDRAGLEPRLFESWIIEKLAQGESQLLSLNRAVEDLRQELSTLRKNLQVLAKKPRK